ncbi:putative DD34D transposase [Trichonephila clavipes]|nr:putative DD34D transposase [Trichonephila clavipes]
MLAYNALLKYHIYFAYPVRILELIGNIREFIIPKKTPKNINGKVPYRFLTHSGEKARLKAETVNGVHSLDIVTTYYVQFGLVNSIQDLLPYGQTQNLDLYRQQLKLAIDQKSPELTNWRGIVFHKDNTGQHASIVTLQKLRELGWEVLMHPPCSPGMPPRDYHVFLAL